MDFFRGEQLHLWPGVVLAGFVLILVRAYRLVDRSLEVLVRLCLCKYLSGGGPQVIWKLTEGTLTLKNIQLSPQILNVLNLPFCCEEASIKEIKLEYPTWIPWSMFISLHISGVSLALRCREYPKARNADEISREQALEREGKKRRTLEAVDAALWGLIPGRKRGPSMCQKLRHRITLRLVQAIRLSLESIKVELMCHRVKDDGALTEMTSSGTRDNKGLIQDQHLVFNARLFAFSSERKQMEASEFILSKVQLKGVKIGVETTRGPSTVKCDRYAILKHWCADANIKCNTSPHGRLKQNSDIIVTVMPSALSVSLSDNTLQWLTVLAMQVTEYFQFSTYRQQRPQAQLLLGLYHRQTVQGSTDSEADAEHTFYSRNCCFQMVRSVAVNRFVNSIHALLHNKLISSNNRWVWAKSMHRKKEDTWGGKISVLYSKFEEVSNLLAKEDIILCLEDSHPGVQFLMTCPKISLSLLPTERKHEACIIESFISGTRLEVSPIIPSAVESATPQRMGVYSIALSCQAFRVCEIAASADQTDSEKPFWLVQSPPASSEVAQGFLKLEVIQHPIQCQHLYDLTLSVAPMDIRLDESPIVQLMHFANIVTAAFQPHNSAFSSFDVHSSSAHPKNRRDTPRMFSNNFWDAITMEVTLGEMKFHFPCHGNAQCFYKGNRGSISSVIQSTTSRLSTNTSGSGGTNPGSIDSSHTYFVFVMGEMSISTAVEDEVEAFLRGGVEQGFRSEHFRKWMDGNSTLHRKEDRSQAKVLSPSKVRMEFSMEAYLTDVRSFRALNSIPVLKVLDPVNVAVQLWSTWGMGNAGPHQDLQVWMKVSNLHAFLTPVTCQQLCALMTTASQALKRCKDKLPAVGSRKEVPLDIQHSVCSRSRATLMLQANFVVSKASIHFVEAESLEDSVSDSALALGRVDMKNIEVGSEMGPDEQRLCITLGSLGVFIEAQEAAERKEIPIIKPLPLKASEFISMSRPKQHQIFRAWKDLVRKHKHTMGHRAFEPEHEPQNYNPQLSGEVVSNAEETGVSISSSFLVIAIDSESLDRCTKFFKLVVEACEAGKKDPSEWVAFQGYTSTIPKSTRSIPPSIQIQPSIRYEDLQEVPASPFLNTREDPPKGLSFLSSLHSSQKVAPEQPTHSAVHIDFCVGCLHVSLASNDISIAAFIGSDVRGNLLLDTPGQPRLFAEFSDINIIDRQSSLDRNKMILDGNCLSGKDSDQDLCHLSLSIVQNQHAAMEYSNSAGDGVEEAVPHASPHLGAQKTGHSEGKEFHTFVKIKCTNLHFVYIARFIKDVSALVEQTFLRPPSPCPQMGARVDDNQTSLGDTYLEVVLEDFQIDVPRCSWAEEFLSLTGNTARIVWPASPALHKKTLKVVKMQEGLQNTHCPKLGDPRSIWEEMEKSSSSSSPSTSSGASNSEQRKMASADQQGPARDCSQLMLETMEDFDTDSEKKLNCLLDGIALLWGSHDSEADRVAVRKVVEGHCAVVEALPSTSNIKVWWPKVYCVLGEIQFSLLMGIIYGNFAEEPLCKPSQPPKVPIGATLPNPPAQPDILGVEMGQPTFWSLEVLFHKAWFLLESEYSPLSDIGAGKEVAQVGFALASLRVEQYECTSIRTQVMSEAFSVRDVRHRQSNAPSTSVVSVQCASQHCRPHLLKLMTCTTLRWQEIIDGISEYIPNATTPFLTSPTPNHNDNTQKENPFSHDNCGTMQRGMVFDYVYHGFPSHTEPGPQVIELILLGAEISWPYLLDSSFSSSISSIFTSYFWQSYCAPHPPPLLTNWIYMNLILEDSHANPTAPMAVINLNPSAQGPKIWWDMLRCGFFWGGDGETHLKMNWETLQADSESKDHRKPFLDPVSGSVSLKSLQPKAKGRKSSLNLDVNITELSVNLAARHVPMLQSLIKCIPSNKKVDENTSATSPTDSFLTAPNCITKIGINVDCIKCLLLDDTNGHSTAVIEASLNALKVTSRFERMNSDKPVVMLATCTAKLLVNHMNYALETMESLVESWPFTLEYRKSDTKYRITAASDAKLNLLMTPASFTSFRDVIDFSYALFGTQNSLTEIVKRENCENSSSDDRGLACRLQNISGMRFIYWAEMEDGPSTSHGLQGDEDAALQVNPPEKIVAIPSTRQQIRAKTICLQFEGNWNPVVNVIVNKVGKYIYELRSQLETVSFPFIVDVALHERTKVVTVHSIFLVKNCTTVNMDFRVNFLFTKNHRGGSRSKQMGTSMKVPSNGVLESEGHCYLPIQAALGAMLYLKASDGTSDFQRAEKDVIRLRAWGAELKEQQGMYTCPSDRPDAKDFHCCLEVQEIAAKTTAIGFEPGMDLGEHALIFHPPISFQNLLPNTVTIKICESPFFASDLVELLIASGESVTLYELDFNKFLRMKVEFAGFTTQQAVEVLSPAKYFRNRHRGPETNDVLLLADSRPATLPGGHQMCQKSLKLKVHHCPIAQSSARRIMVYSAYWVINKTNIPLELKNSKPTTHSHFTARPVSEDSNFPVLFTSPKGTVRVGVDKRHWSKSINMETLGIKRSFSVIGAVDHSKEEVVTQDSDDDSPRRTNSSPAGALLESSSSTSQPLPPSVLQGPQGGLSTVSEEAITQQPLTWKQEPKHSCYEFTVAVALGPGLFECTKVVTLMPRFLIVNYTGGYAEFYANITTVFGHGKQICVVKSRESLPFHWHNSDGRREVCIQPRGVSWRWSGGFRLDEVNNFGLKIRHRYNDSFKIMPIDISDKGDSMVCIVKEEQNDPPYRIENRCMGIVIRFHQQDVSIPWESVEPGHSVRYAWDEPYLTHRLRIMMDGRNIGIEDPRIQEYSLDNIKAHPTIVLGRKLKAVGALVATMGRRGKCRPDKADQMSPLARSNLDPDVARVFVHVFADGSTRVIRFSDTPDSQLPTIENNLTLLNKKMMWLKQSVEVVDRELESFADAPGMNLDKMLTQNPGNPDRLAANINACKDMLRKPSNLGRLVLPLSISRGGTSTSNRSSTLEEIPDKSCNEIQSDGPTTASLGSRTQSQDPRHTLHHQSSGGKIRQLLRRVSGLQVAMGDDEDDDAREKYSERGEDDRIPSWVQPQDSTATAAAAVENRPQLEKRQSGVFENVLAQFGATSMKNIMLQSGTEGFTTDASKSSFEVSGPSSLHQTASPGINQSADVPVLPSKVCSTPSISEAGSQDHRKSGIGLPAVDIQRARPNRTTSTSNDVIALADLASFSMKVKEKRRVRAQIPELLGIADDTSLLPDGGEILGGELVVKIMCAQGLLGSSAQPVDGRTGLGARLARNSASGRGIISRLSTDIEVFCVLKCEGQERRTLKIPVCDKPRWDHETHFHSVPVTSHLVVTMLGRGGIMGDVFLGEVVIPLVEIEDMADPDNEDVRAYTLGRRKGNEKVSGEVFLSLAWRVTPLDRLTLKVKALQEEFEDRNELLALLKARQAEDWHISTLSSMNTCKDDDCLPYLMQTATLEVKVIEARNLMAPFDRLRSNYAMNAYVIVTCDRQTRHVSHQTAVQKNKLCPRWNTSYTFEDIDVSSNLLVQVFDKRNLRANDFLGQVVLSVMCLKDGRPHYAWFPLQPRGPKDHRAGGEIRLRLRWSKNEAWDEDADSCGISFDLNLHWIGISVVESSVKKPPREIMHIHLDQLSASYRRNGPDESFRFVLNSIQIDNQLITSAHPVAFYQTLQPSQEAAGSRSESMDNALMSQTKPILEIRLEKLNQDEQTGHVRYFTLLLQEVDLVLEKQFLDIMLQWYDELPLNDLWGSHVDEATVAIESLMQQPSCGELAEEHIRSSGVQWYFEVLHIQPIKINISLLPSARAQEGEMSRRYRIVSSLGINLLDVVNMPLKINAMILKNAFMQPRELARQVFRHILLQILRDVHKILGSVELLGTPVKLGSSIIAGVASFFYEPAKGIVHGPEEFAKGLATGTVNLVKNSMAGVCTTVGHFTEGFGKTLAALSMDDQYYQRFQSKQQTNREMILQGTQILGWGCIQGVTGVIMDPVLGAEKDGIPGFAKGCATGVAGLITKPTSGILGFASKTVSGIGGGIRTWGDEAFVKRRRVRPPRDFGIFNGLQVEEADFIRWREFLVRSHSGKFRGDDLMDIVHHNSKVLLITTHRFVYVKPVKKIVKWVIDGTHIISVGTIDFDISIQCKYAHSRKSSTMIKMVSRKRIVCTTSDMQHFILVKIDCHLERMRLALREQAGDETNHGVGTSSRMEGISIMNARPPSPMADTPMSPEGLHLADISSAPPHSTNHDKCSLEDMKHPFHDKDAGVGVSDLLLPTSNPGRSVSLQQSPGTMADPSQSVGTEACSLHNQLSAEQINTLSTLVTSIDLVALSIGHSASDREGKDALASIGQISLTCLSLPSLIHPSLHTVGKLVGSINRLSFSSDAPLDTILQTVHVLCAAIFDLLENVKDPEGFPDINKD